MQVLDASSALYAWDNYPVEQFVGLWDWIADLVNKEKVVIPKVAFQEIKHKSPDCADWFSKCGVKRLDATPEILSEALRIQSELGIKNDQFHPKGVDAKDIEIIATALVHKAELISDEGRQAQLPKEIKRRKIPSVCAMASVGVSCISFIDYVKRSGQVFR